MSSTEKTAAPEERGTKRDSKDAKLDEADVHSPNNWEGANLGDDQRNQKFLRLMGAKKTEHTGRFVIGDHEARTDRTQDESELLEEKLESQYKEGLGLKLSGAARHHTGLGFKPEDEEDDEPTADTTDDDTKKTEEQKEEDKTEEKKEKEGDKKVEKKEKKVEKKEKKEEVEEDDKANGDTKPEEKTEEESAKKPFMKFVKASD